MDIEKHQHWVSLFSTWTRESAYYYGVILGDGHVSDSTIYLGCQYEICKGFYKFLGIEREPREHRVAKIYTCIVHSEYLVKWFRGRGVLSKKSKNLPWPHDISESLIWHFIRGLIDTDGHVSLALDRHGKQYLRIGFASSCEEFTKVLCEKMDANCWKSNKVMNGFCFYHFYFKLSQTSSIKYGELIYKDSDNLRFSEKYNRYIEGVLIYNNKKLLCTCGKPSFTDNKCMECFWKEREQNKDKICKENGCENVVNKAGLCTSHYHKQRRKIKAEQDGRTFVPRVRNKIAREKYPI